MKKSVPILCGAREKSARLRFISNACAAGGRNDNAREPRVCSVCIFSAQLRGSHGEQQALIVFVLVQELGLLRFCASGCRWPVVSAFGKGKKFQTGSVFL